MYLKAITVYIGPCLIRLGCWTVFLEQLLLLLWGLWKFGVMDPGWQKWFTVASGGGILTSIHFLCKEQRHPNCHDDTVP